MQNKCFGCDLSLLETILGAYNLYTYTYTFIHSLFDYSRLFGFYPFCTALTLVCMGGKSLLFEYLYAHHRWSGLDLKEFILVILVCPLQVSHPTTH